MRWHVKPIESKDLWRPSLTFNRSWIECSAIDSGWAPAPSSASLFQFCPQIYEINFIRPIIGSFFQNFSLR